MNSPCVFTVCALDATTFILDSLRSGDTIAMCDASKTEERVNACHTPEASPSCPRQSNMLPMLP